MQRATVWRLYRSCLIGLCLSLGSLTLAQDQSSISPDEIISDNLDTASANYSFSAHEGDEVTISLSSRAFDALLLLYTPDGTEAARNDDSNGSLDSKIESLKLPQDGDYTVMVSSFDGTGRGPYRLSMSLSELSIESLNYGDNISAELSASRPEIVYRFEGRAGDMPLIDMRSTAFDPYLTLTSAEGVELNSDDDGGIGRDSLIFGYPLPEDASYFVHARAFYTGTGGPFTLAMTQLELRPITPGATVQGQLDAEPQFYSFEGHYGDIINVRFVGDGRIDSILIIRTPTGYTSREDDDSGVGLDPEIMNVLLDKDGLFILALIPYSPDQSGPFQLTLTNERPQLLEAGQTRTITIKPKHPARAFRLDAGAGETIRVSLSKLDHLNFNVPSISIVQHGQTLEATTHGDPVVDTLISETTVPEDGEVIVIVRESTFRAGSYDLLLERS